MTAAGRHPASADLRALKRAAAHREEVKKSAEISEKETKIKSERMHKAKPQKQPSGRET